MEVGSPRLRQARPEDEAALLALDREAWSPQSGFPSAVADSGFYSTDGAGPADHLVAELDRRVAGYIRLRPPTPLPENEHVLAINGLAVAPWARRRGVAAALLEAAVTHAEAAGRRKLSLRVFSTNAAAISLYRRCGFSVEGVLRGEFIIEGQPVDDILMARRLDPPPLGRE